ncbi:MAG: efflux RND transporter periplasmic adaptor subunit [Sphingomonadales bacterium]|nr:efflux RND transporter periplasmic adaptor subunit [Sphingomonadales bacterium]
MRCAAWRNNAIFNSQFASMRKFNLLWAFSLPLLVAAGCGESSKKSPNSMGGGEKNKPLKVDLFVVRTSSYAENIEVPGTIVASESVEIHPEVAGRIVKLPIEEGRFIEKGSLLAKLNDADLVAQLNKLEIQLQLAQQTEKRQAQLLKIQGISQQDYDISLLQVNSLKADIGIIKTSIEKTEIRAPFSGKLGLRNISNGAYVNSASVIAVINQTDQLKLDFSIPEKYISKIRNGQSVYFRFEGSSDSLTARVVATESKVTENSRSLQVRALVASKSSALLPGSFAKVSIGFDPDPNAMLIPTQAILPQARGKKVILYKGGVAVFTDIKTGSRTADRVQITDGLSAGDTVVTTGLLSVRPDAPITIGKILNPLP